MAENGANRKRILLILFLSYTAAMLWLLFFRTGGWIPDMDYRQQLRQNINLIPFYTTRNYARVIFRHTNEDVFWHCVMNLGGNVGLFIPAGLLIPAIWEKMRKLYRFLPLCAGVMFLVETLQLFALLGRFDIDDLILNLLGMLLGFLLWRLFGKNKTPPTA